MVTSWCDIFLTCRNTRPRAVLKPDWWKSLTSWRWFCRLMSMKSWKELQEDCRSSLTPLMVCLCSIGIDPFCSFALIGFVGFQVVSTTPTCSSSLDLWVNRGGVTWQWQSVQRFPRTRSRPLKCPHTCTLNTCLRLLSVEEEGNTLDSSGCTWRQRPVAASDVRELGKAGPGSFCTYLLPECWILFAVRAHSSGHVCNMTVSRPLMQ